MVRVSVGMSGPLLSFSRERETPFPLPPVASSSPGGTAEHSYRVRFLLESLSGKYPLFLATTMVPFPLHFSSHYRYSLWELGESIGPNRAMEVRRSLAWLGSLLSLTHCPVLVVQLPLAKEPSLGTDSCTVLGPVLSRPLLALPAGLLLPAGPCEPVVARFMRIRPHWIQPEACDSRISSDERS